MRSGRSRWAHAAIAAALAASLASLFGGEAQAGGVSGRAAHLELAMKATAASTVPGGAAQVAILLTDTGDGAARAGAGFTVTAPAGFRFAGATDLATLPGFGAAGSGGHWSCSRTADGARCAYGIPLPAKGARGLLVRFAVDPSQAPGGGGAIRAAGTGAGSGSHAAVRVRVVAGTPSPSLIAAVAGTAGVRTDRGGVETVDVLNAGSGPASSVSLAGLLPVSVVGSWAARGAGWRCSGSAGSAPSCTNATPVAVGQRAPRLTIAYRLDPARVAALHLQIGGKPSVQRWSIGVSATGGAKPFAARTPASMVVIPPPGALLVPTAVAAHGLQELLPGTATTLHVRVANIGGAPTDGQIGVGGIIPAGVSIERVSGDTAWTCNGGSTPQTTTQQFSCMSTSARSIAPKRSLDLSLVVKADPDATPGQGFVSLTAAAQNEIGSAKPRATSLPLLILEGNAGFPALTLLRAAKNASFAPVVDGSAAKAVSGQGVLERLDVRNAGGAAIAAGTRAELVQQLRAGARITSIRAPQGWSCSGTTSLSCTVTFANDVAPAAAVEGPTVVVAAGRATAATQNWPASVRLAEIGAAKTYVLPVLVDVAHGAAQLVPNFTNVHVPTAGGFGVLGLGVRNDGNAATPGPVQLGIHLPRGVHVQSVGAPGWACATVATSARCTSAGSLAQGRALPHLRLTLDFATGTENRTLDITASAAAGGRPSRATIQVVPRHGLRAVIKEPDKVAWADQPLVRAHEKLTPTVLVLEGDGSGGSGLGLRYAWQQRCTTAADAAAKGSHCSSVTPSVTWLGPRTEPDVRFATPQVSKPTVLVFDLTVNDGSAHATAFTRITVLPLPKGTTGFTIRNAHPAAERALGPARERKALPKPAEKLKPAKRRTHHDTAPPATTTTTDTTATTTTGTTTGTTTSATTTGATTTTGPALPALFCQLVRDALAANGSFSASIAGGVSFHFRNVTVSGTACDTGTTVSFSSSSFGVHGYLHASGVSGSISQAGLAITSGTLTGPDAWNAPTFSLDGGGLSIPFGGGSASLSGTISADGFAFVPLPSGWKGSTSVSFGSGSSGTSVSVATDATGPKRDASPGSAAPTATVSGSVASDGTFSLSVDVRQIVQLDGHAVNVTGSVKREEPGGPLAIAMEGSLDAPFSIVPGVQVSQLKVKFAPTESALGITGSGVVDLAAPSGKVGIHVALAYDDPGNWSLTAEGVGDTAWEPVPGMRIAAKDFSGAIVAKNDAYELTLKATPSSDWTPTSSITVSNLALTLSNVCPDTGAPCPKDGSIFLDLKANAAFDLPAVGTVKTRLAGSLALPSGDFSVEASLEQPLRVGAGISIDQARVLIQHGLAAASEEPTAEAVDGGQFRVDLTGAVTLPGIGKLPTVHASFGSKGWAVVVPLGGFSLPGASGDGSKLANTVVGWASYATTMRVVDPATKAVTTISLPANGFKLTGDFATPSWLRKTLGLPGDINGRATGLFDPENDTYSLRMEFSIPGEPYLYGSATSATNVRLTSTYFEISRRGGDFNVALGGAAQMNVAASGGLDASSVELGVALSYAISSQTVAGTLSFTSPGGWKNAFGTRELTLYDLAIGFEFNIPTLTPGIGFGARAVLPPTWRSQLGITNGARTTLVAKISVTNPCLGIQVDDPTNTGQTVLSIGNGALTAKTFDLRIAPTGCTVGQFTYAPGVSVQFDGNVAGISVAIKARIGLSPFGFDGTADIGEIPVGGLTIKKTHLDVALSSGKVKIEFSGGVEAFGTNVDIKGSINKSGAAVISDFTGTLDKLTVGDTLSATGLAVRIHTETGAKNVLEFAAQGKITLLGSSADAKFNLSLANGQLNEAKADVAAVVRIGSTLTLDGTFKIDYAKTRPIAIDAAVKAKYGSQELANATVTVRSGYLAMTASFGVAGVFNASLEGAAYFGAVPSGTQITLPSGAKTAARTGDFYLSARDVSLTLAGFKGSGAVWVGQAGGTSQAYVDGRLQVTGTASDNTVAVAGSIDGNGNFSLTGSANLNLAGFTPNVTVTVQKSGSTVSVSGAASVKVVDSSIAVSGDFRYDAGQFRFRLNGVGSIAAGGYTLANSDVSYSNFPEDAGLSAQISIGAGSVLNVSGRLNIEPGGRFAFSANTNVNLGATVNANVTFANYGDSCTPYLVRFFVIGWRCQKVDFAPRLTADASMSVAGFSFGVSVVVGSDGSFSATARTPTSGETVKTTPTISLLVVKGYGKLSYHFALTISNRAAPKVDGAGSASIEYEYWTFWDGWNSGSIGVSLSLRTEPFEACAYARIAGSDIGGCVS